MQLSLASNAPVVTDFCREFDRVFGSAERLEDANPPGVKPAAVSSRCLRQGRLRSTVAQALRASLPRL